MLYGSFNWVIKYLMSEKNIGKELLTTRTRLSKSTIEDIVEGNHNNPTLRTLEKIIERGFEMNFSEFFDLCEENSFIAPVSLRRFANAEELDFKTGCKLALIPVEGKEPQTEEAWRDLYNSVREYV